MTVIDNQKRKLEIGTSGWHVSDLDDPELARQWDEGRYEIIEGVLKTMPPAFFNHGAAVFELLMATCLFVRSKGLHGDVSQEVDLVVDEETVLRVDGMLIGDDKAEEQRAVQIQLGESSEDLQRIRVAPLLVIESISRGHESHDWRVKRRIYSGFKIPNYWIVDSGRRTLSCLALAPEGDYLEAASGTEIDKVSPPAFPGLEIDLAKIWKR